MATAYRRKVTIRVEIRVMKKLLVLAAVLVLMSGAAGCRCCDWMWRGAYSPCSNPCAPVASACVDTCAPVATCEACGSAPAIVPGPAPYAAAAPCPCP